MLPSINILQHFMQKAAIIPFCVSVPIYFSGFQYSAALTKRSYVLKETCIFQLQVSLSTYDLLVNAAEYW